MTDNEKAAIAAGLWKPSDGCHQCIGTVALHSHAPDMHDPANLWRALENLSSVVAVRWLFDEQPRCAFYIQHKAYGLVRHDENWRLSLADAVFAALVALYDVEHPSTDE